MRYPQPNDRYDCSVLCSNFMEIEEKFKSQSEEIERVRRSSVMNSGAIMNKAEGETIAVTDSAKEPPFSIALYGKAKQKTTSGKNLIPYPYINTNSTNRGITFTEGDNGTIIANGTNDSTGQSFINVQHIKLKAGETYKISHGTIPTEDSPSFCIIYFKDETGAAKVPDATAINPENGSVVKVSVDFIATLSNEKYYADRTFTVNEDVDVQFQCRVNNTGKTVTNLKFYPMLRLASITDDTWEQPTNGATPRPDYPQEIEVSGASGTVEVKSVGKNLYNRNSDINRTNVGVTATISEGVMVLNGTATGAGALPGYANDIVDTIDVNVGDILAFSIKILEGNATIASSTTLAFVRCMSENNVELVKPCNIGKVGGGIIDKTTEFAGKSFVVTEDMLGSDGRLRISIQSYVRANDIYNNLKLAVQLEKSSVVTEYQSYKETISTIPTPNGLAGIKVSSGGNYTEQNGQQWICDEVVKYADGSGEYVQRVYKHKVTNVRNYNAPRIFIALPKAMKMHDTTSNIYSICNRFTAVRHTGVIVSIDNSCGGQEDIYGFRSDSLGFTTAEEWEEWFAKNETIIWYVLAEPIRTPLTAEQISEMEKITMFNPVTNVTNDANVYMAIEYIADANIYIDNLKAAHDADIRKLTAAIEALGGTVE